jgi:hypothetical protein
MGDSGADVLAAVLRDAPPPVPDAPAVMQIVDRCLTKTRPGAAIGRRSQGGLESCLAEDGAVAASIAVRRSSTSAGATRTICRRTRWAIIDALTASRACG